MKRALVTGGAGFIGSHLVDLLLQEGHEVLALDDLSRGRLSNLKEALKNPRFSFHQVDILDEKRLGGLFEGIDWVFHLAGLADVIASVDQPARYFDVNVKGTLNVIEAARKGGVSRLIYAASASCYGEPDQIPTPESAPLSTQFPYALSKKMGEDLVLHWSRVYGLEALSLRLFNVYGPRVAKEGYGAVFGVFLAQKLNDRALTIVGDGEQSRDFTFVTDVARAFYSAALSSKSAQVYNVGSGCATSINELAALFNPKGVERLPKRPSDPRSSLADISLIKRELGWRPEIALNEGVKRLLNAIEDFREVPLWDAKGIEKASRSWFHYLGNERS